MYPDVIKIFILTHLVPLFKDPKSFRHKNVSQSELKLRENIFYTNI